VFPVLNKEGIELYKKLGLDLKRPLDIKTYAENVRIIKKFRDENFSFKNYRVIDLYLDYHFSEEEDNSTIVSENEYEDRNYCSFRRSYRRFS